jgi:DNA-binding MarR family transcriptional regulator
VSNQRVYIEARKYLFKNYEEIMSLYSAIYTQIESEHANLSNQQVSAISAYYAIVSHKTLDNFPIISKIEKAISNNKDKELTDMEDELAVAILVESRIHELEKRGFVEIDRGPDGETSVNLTDLGREASEELGEDIRKSDKFNPQSL